MCFPDSSRSYHDKMRAAPYHVLEGPRSPVRQLNWVSIGILAVAKAKKVPLPDLAEFRAARDQLFADGCDITGAKYDLGPFPSRLRRPGVERNPRRPQRTPAQTFSLETCFNPS